MSNIEEDINRCKELIKKEHENWIGITNQIAIKNLLSDREKWKKNMENDLVHFVKIAQAFQRRRIKWKKKKQ